MHTSLYVTMDAGQHTNIGRPPPFQANMAKESQRSFAPYPLFHNQGPHYHSVGLRMRSAPYCAKAFERTKAGAAEAQDEGIGDDHSFLVA